MNYEAKTRGLVVKVTPQFLPDQTDPGIPRYVWSYTVDVENHGQETVSLISRHWEITDGLGRVEIIDGPGVVGETPTLKTGEAFRYTSGCPLSTPSGMMRGAYQMITQAGEHFDAEVPAFSLHMPEATQRLN